MSQFNTNLELLGISETIPEVSAVMYMSSFCNVHTNSKGATLDYTRDALGGTNFSTVSEPSKDS